MATCAPQTGPDRLLVAEKKTGSGKEALEMKKLFAMASPTTETVACAALLAGVCAELLAGTDDIRRFWRIFTM